MVYHSTGSLYFKFRLICVRYLKLLSSVLSGILQGVNHTIVDKIWSPIYKYGSK